jgi:hypothetical protein
MTVFNIYCDESCHLEHDGLPIMLFGAIWCPAEKTRAIAAHLREIKLDHGLSSDFEIKWSKVSPGKLAFYQQVLQYFFTTQELHFRVLVVSDKSQLRHEQFDQDHDTFYFKMYFALLKMLLNPHSRYRIYLDIKDTRSGDRIEKLREVLSTSIYDFSSEIIERVQAVRSHEVEQVQLADLLIGAVGYANRGLTDSPAKTALVMEMRRLSGYSLQKTTLLREDKVNIFRWAPWERPV